MSSLNQVLRPGAAALAGWLLGPAPTHAQPAGPPPYAVPPVAPASGTPALTAATVARRTQVETAHAEWKIQDGGADYRPSLTYLRDRPVLLLVTVADEPGPKALHRKRAIVQAGGFLLDDTAFDRATVCVVTLDSRQPGLPRVRNHDLARTTFQAAAKTATQSGETREALRQAREVDAHTLKICADLGID